MKHYHFLNTVHARTDLIGKHHHTWKEVGFQHYPEDKEKHVDGNAYHSLDEVLELHKSKQTTDNMYVDEQGIPKLRARNLSAITAFTIVNGIVFTRRKGEHDRLVEYAKKIGYAFDAPIPISMYAGTKTMDILGDNVYRVHYKIEPAKLGIYLAEEVENLRNGELNALIYGTLHALHERKMKTMRLDGPDISPVCAMRNWTFRKSTLTLSVELDGENVSKEAFIHMLQRLDLEIYHLVKKEHNWLRHLHALKQLARNYGQPHWINEAENDYSNHFSWADKEVPALLYTFPVHSSFVYLENVQMGTLQLEEYKNVNIYTYRLAPKTLPVDEKEAEGKKKLLIGTCKSTQERLVKEGNGLLLYWEYNEDNGTLRLVAEKEVSITIERILFSLDLQLYYFWHHEFDWHEHLFALMQVARDKEAYDLISEEDKGKSHIRLGRM